MTVRVSRDAEEFDAAMRLRIRVFCDEQGVDGEEEFDGLDEAATLVVAVDEKDVVGTCRLRYPDGPGGDCKLERMAVERRLRGSGVGRRILDFSEDLARESGSGRMILNAQRAAEPFYASAGYEAEGETFIEAKIEHVRMVKPLGGGDGR